MLFRSEELPHVQGQGQKQRGPHAQKAVAKRSYPTPEARGGSGEEQPHARGALAAWAQEGLEELSHIEGQEGVVIPKPRTAYTS